MDSCFYEVVTTICLEKDVPVRDVQSVLSVLVSNAMMSDEQLKAMHRQNCFKHFVYCSPYPLESDRVYRGGRMYCFNLRTRNLGFASAMKAYLPRTKGFVKVVSIELRSYPKTHISELVSLTPVISTVNNRCWMPENGLGLLAERLHSNAARKCNALDATVIEPDEIFFESIQLLNRKPVVVGYKGTSLLGHKVRLSVKPNEWAQQLAFTALGGGLGEKNALGFGYCLAK